MGNYRQVLIISHAPPTTEMAGARALQFVRHLPNFGWTPHVLTTENGVNSLLQVTGMPEQACRQQKSDCRIGTAGHEWPRQSNVSDNSEVILDQRMKIWRGIRGLFSSGLRTLQEVWWPISAGIRGVRFVRSQQVDCVYTMSQNAGNHVAGLIIKGLTGVKWVADLTGYPGLALHEKEMPGNTFHYTFVERITLHYANLITTDSKMYRETRLHASSRVISIGNGVDSNQFQPSADLRLFHSGPFTFLCYSKDLHLRRAMKTFLQAVAMLVKYKRISPSEIRIRIVGARTGNDRAEYMELLKTLGLQHVVELIPEPVDDQLRKYMVRAHALVLLGDQGREGRNHVPDELYEYLFARRFILALLEEGSAAELITRTRAGKVVPIEEVKYIANVIEQLIKAPVEEIQAFRPDLQEISKYSQLSQTRLLAAGLDGLVAEGLGLDDSTILYENLNT
jgi:glycosyltransferase involved in cell wall biosynthesis